jgi:hypothetical protein
MFMTLNPTFHFAGVVASFAPSKNFIKKKFDANFTRLRYASARQAN